VLVEGTKLARRIAATGKLDGWMSGERAPGSEVQSDDEIEAWVRGAAQTIYHPAGTCALGSVVDADLRVNGVEALRVADASVMPSLNRGHTHAPTTMLAERAAEKIAA
jgi:choline dehydrogenase